MSTTEFIMFAFLLCIGIDVRMRNPNIRIVDEIFVVVHSSSSPLAMDLGCNFSWVHIFIYLQFCNSHVHHQLFIISRRRQSDGCAHNNNAFFVRFLSFFCIVKLVCDVCLCRSCGSSTLHHVRDIRCEHNN